MFIAPFDTKNLCNLKNQKKMLEKDKTKLDLSDIDLEESLNKPKTNPREKFLQEYLSDIEQYKDNPYIYKQLTDAYNSYANQRFSPTILQGIGQFFGDYSASTNFDNEIISGLSAEKQKILEGLHQEQYSDPSAQMQRMREAGLNPDLSGGDGISSGEPASIDQADLNQPVTNSGQSDIPTIAQIGTSIVSFAMQTFTGVQNIQSLFLDNALKELSFSDSMRESAWSIISEGVTEFLGSNKGKFTREEMLDPSFVELAPSLVESFGSRVNSLPLSRRQKKALRDVVDNLTFSFNGNEKVPTAKYQALVNGLNSDLFKSRNELAQSSSLPGADKESIDAIRAIGNDIYKPLVDQSIKLEKSINSVKALQAQFDADYLKTANDLGLGGMSASAEFASRKLVHEMQTAKNEITQSFAKIRDKILHDSNLGEKWKTALLTGTSIAEVFTMNTLLSSTASLNFGIRVGGQHDTRDTYVHMK